MKIKTILLYIAILLLLPFAIKFKAAVISQNITHFSDTQSGTKAEVSGLRKNGTQVSEFLLDIRQLKLRD